MCLGVLNSCPFNCCTYLFPFFPTYSACVASLPFSILYIYLLSLASHCFFTIGRYFSNFFLAQSNTHKHIIYMKHVGRHCTWPALHAADHNLKASLTLTSDIVRSTKRCIWLVAVCGMCFKAEMLIITLRWVAAPRVG